MTSLSYHGTIEYGGDYMAVASDKTRINVQISKSLKSKAEAVALAENRSLSNLIVHLLAQYVEQK